MRATGWLAVVVLSLVFGLVGSLLGYKLLGSREAAGTEPALSGVARPGGTISVKTDQDAIVQAVKKAAPGVVTVTTVSTAPASQGPFGLPAGPPQERQGLGSGFVFEQDGRKLILTNMHVVEGAQQVTVHTAAGQEFAGKVLGASGEDLAVIEPVNPPADLATIPLGDSESIPVGAWVIAIGSPFGFDNTVTVGVVSRKGYAQTGPGSGRYLIQTDAAINSGNSGGPLLDLGGNVIGINEMIFSPTQTNLGIGWAIPINEAKELMYFLINHGPWVGVGAVPNSPGLARYLGLGTDQGVVVADVASGSPAARAGLQVKDVILQIDGQPVKTREDLRKLILARKIGDKLSFSIQRDGQGMTVEVEAGTAPQVGP